MNVFEQALIACGPWMYPLLAGAIIVLSVIVERGVTLFFRWSIRVPVLLDQLEKLVRTGNTDRAIRLCRAIGPDVPIGRVVQAGLERSAEGPEPAAEAMKAAAASARPMLRRRLAALPVLGTACLALGLLGSYQLGAFAPPVGAATPLPFDQPMAMAPALSGGAVVLVAQLAFVALLFRAIRLSRELDVARERLTRLFAERGARPPFEAGPPDSGALPRLGGLGRPPGHIES